VTSSLAISEASFPARQLWDLVIVGGGPAGLVVAIVAAEQGLSVIVVERPIARQTRLAAKECCRRA